MIKVGDRFGRWVVLDAAGRTPQRAARWRVRCQCGSVKLVRGDNLGGGSAKSCGCLRRDLLADRNRGRAA
jgi:hypothetical protein